MTAEWNIAVSLDENMLPRYSEVGTPCIYFWSEGWTGRSTCLESLLFKPFYICAPYQVAPVLSTQPPLDLPLPSHPGAESSVMLTAFRRATI